VILVPEFMNLFHCALAVPLLLHANGVFAADLTVRLQGAGGAINWSNIYQAGVATVETATDVTGPWFAGTNYFTSNTVSAASISLTQSNTFIKLLAVDISTNSPRQYTNLLESYGTLETVAGIGQANGDKTSYWQASYEGGWATNAQLSRPHIAFGDSRGDVLIVDQGSSSVLKVTPEGRIYTYAGTHTAGNNGDGPDYATNLHLNFPNGGWLRSDDTLFVLDTENGKVRKVETNGMMRTLFTTSPLGDGRALWVKNDESLIYFGSGAAVGANVTVLNKWTPTGGVSVVRSDFLNMGNICGDERTGDLFISDRDANRVYRMDTNAVLTPIAGNGAQTGGGEGFPALQTGLVLPRSVWFIPNGGFFIGEHDPGNRIWYVDPAGVIHRWMNGNSSNNRRVGDGQWFYASPATAKVSRVRSVNTDPFGNLIIVESNYGYIRRVRFQRMTP
jgi:hypothetical protein